MPDGIASVAPFVGPDGILLHYGGRQQHVFSCSDTAGIGLA